MALVWAGFLADEHFASLNHYKKTCGRMSVRIGDKPAQSLKGCCEKIELRFTNKRRTYLLDLKSRIRITMTEYHEIFFRPRVDTTSG